MFMNELVWREFLLQILHNFPRVATEAFRREHGALEWSADRDHFPAWREARTGYPLVDSAMRWLNMTGWMHNRLRMIVAMFLTKDLLLNRPWGENRFRRKLLNGDLATDNGGCQRCAGTGAAVAAYFGIFNPVAQGKKYDPAVEFIRRWVPGLAPLPDGSIHEPCGGRSVGRRLDCPRPIVIHAEQRSRCLARLESIRRRLIRTRADGLSGGQKEKGRTPQAN